MCFVILYAYFGPTTHYFWIYYIIIPCLMQFNARHHHTEYNPFCSDVLHYAPPLLWNHLPLQVQESNSISTFLC